MAKHPPDIQDILGLRHGWTPIALLFTSGSVHTIRLLELARERRWRLISLSKFEGTLPPDLKVSGAFTDRLPTHENPAGLRAHGIPLVRIGNWPHPRDADAPAVMPDHPAAGRLAAAHFAERDFKHVACVGHRPWGDNQTVYEAFKSRAEELGMACHLLREDGRAIRQLPDNLQRLEYRRRRFIDWVQTLPRPVGLFMFSDFSADRCCQWVLDSGLSVPTDVAVLGIGNDVAMCECASVPTSSIAHNPDGLAEAAVDTLARLMESGPLESTTIRVPPLGVVTRRSTDVLAASDPRVARALRYMWDHVTEDLSVDQIAEHAGVARRTLEIAFQRDLQRGINQEFQRRRLEKARELLISTDLKVIELAETLQFSSHHYFCRVFRAAYGTSPARYLRDAGQ